MRKIFFTPFQNRPARFLTGVFLLSLGAGGIAAVNATFVPEVPATPLVTGKRLTPRGSQTNVGSFPANMAMSPDGQFLIVTNVGMRSFLSVLRSSDGKMVSQLDWNADSPVFKKKKQALYVGLVCGAEKDGQTPVYASGGAEGTVAVLSLSAAGVLTDTGRKLGVAQEGGAFVAGLSLSADGTQIYAADNSANPNAKMRGALQVLSVSTGKIERKIELPGYPYALASAKNGAIYVSSEQRGVVSVIEGTKPQKDIATGTQPVALLLDRAQKRLFVANAGSDTLSLIDTRKQRVTRTILLRPQGARGLPGATPTGLALSPDEKRLYVTLADLNAVAVVDLPGGTLAGYIPVGWYPTAALVSSDGRRLFVANAKGVAARNPNAAPNPNLKERPQYIQNLIEGTVSTLDLSAIRDLRPLTAQVISNNASLAPRAAKFVNPGIKHVFYIIKENRTYDQILGDLGRGDGDPTLALFGREVTPNLHALANRFALLDNFYCCAEVSGDGWNWSTGGMISEFTARNVPHSYGGRVRSYDFEGTNNGVPVDRLNIPDAARPPGGYLWDLAARNRVSFRNYGFFTDDLKLPRTLPEEGTQGLENTPTKRALVGKTDLNFRQYDMNYPDSEAFALLGIDPFTAKQAAKYSAMPDASRVAAWKRDFKILLGKNAVPALSMLRLPRDHTSGTTPGVPSPRAMVADNDFAVGQIVQTISQSPVWASSAIIIIEDDAQNGYDHVDAHRSTCFVISPFVERGRHDSRFYNTDSALKTIEMLLGMPPMTAYDAGAAPIAVFGTAPLNAEPFQAIMPSRAIISEINTKDAPGAALSARLLDPLKEESAPDEALNAILWHAVKGAQKPPARRYGIRLTSKNAETDDD